MALDGLRGLAASAVVLHHVFMVSPTLAETERVARPSLHGVDWWLTYTPLHLLWAGREAVYVFFVLSGFVLAASFTGATDRLWRGYFPRRLARLYLPVWGAVVLAVLSFVLVDHAAQAGQSWWLRAHDVPLTANGVVRDAALVLGSAGEYATPLWSLTWEVLFSLALPLYLLAARVPRRWVLLGLPVLVAASAVGGTYGFSALTYLPMFGLGVVMALHRERIARSVGRLGRPLRTLMLGLGVVLVCARWLVPAFPADLSLPLLGAMLLFLLFLADGSAVRVGSSAALQWLGKRSFSLYLVHEPIVVSVALALGTTAPWPVLAISVPASLLVSALFYRAVEQPSHRLARRLGRMSARPFGGQAFSRQPGPAGSSSTDAVRPRSTSTELSTS